MFVDNDVWGNSARIDWKLLVQDSPGGWASRTVWGSSWRRMPVAVTANHGRFHPHGNPWWEILPNRSLSSASAATSSRRNSYVHFLYDATAFRFGFPGCRLIFDFIFASLAHFGLNSHSIRRVSFQIYLNLIYVMNEKPISAHVTDPISISVLDSFGSWLQIRFEPLFGNTMMKYY